MSILHKDNCTLQKQKSYNKLLKYDLQHELWFESMFTEVSMLHKTSVPGPVFILLDYSDFIILTHITFSSLNNVEDGHQEDSQEIESYVQFHG